MICSPDKANQESDSDRLFIKLERTNQLICRHQKASISGGLPDAVPKDKIQEYTCKA
jgi:hypothetical protein